MRMYLTDTKVYMFRGEEYSIGTMEAEVGELMRRIETLLPFP
jgi:hypothetical protein